MIHNTFSWDQCSWKEEWKLLNNGLKPCADEMPLTVYQFYFQQDGAPLAKFKTDWMKFFPGNGLGGGTNQMSAKIPDLMPLDFSSEVI